MERKYYKNGVEAPQKKETEYGIIYNYNSEANHELLIADGYEPSDDINRVVPAQITMRQTKLALLNRGLLDTVNQAVESLDETAKIEWEYSAVTERNSPFVSHMGMLLGLTEEEVDELFIYAETL